MGTRKSEADREARKWALMATRTAQMGSYGDRSDRDEMSQAVHLFPHVYGTIARTAVVAVRRVVGATSVDEALEAPERS